MFIDFRVGLLHFDEMFGKDLQTFLNQIPCFEDENGNNVKISAEHIIIHEIDLRYPTPYKMIIDRSSHYLKQAMGILMAYAFKGVHIVNNPFSFHYFIANKDAAYAMMDSLGVKVPRTYILPPKKISVFKEDNFPYHRHFNWDEMIQMVKFPCYIKPAEGRGARGVKKIYDMESLWEAYDQSGEEVMTVQQCVPTPYTWQVRCLCIGRKIVPIKYIFRDRDKSEYIFEQGFLTEETGKKVLESAMIINRVFGYEMNSVEFIIDHEGNPWAIDFNNPVPDGRKKILGEVYYKDYISCMGDLVCDVAKGKIETQFVPEINLFSEIACQDHPNHVKYKRALNIAEKYYSEKGDIQNEFI